MEIRFPFSVHQLSKVVNCIDPCGTMRCILLEDKQAVSARENRRQMALAVDKAGSGDKTHLFYLEKQHKASAASSIRLKFGQFGKRTRWKSGFGMECCFGELTRASVGLLWIDGSKRKGWVLFDFHQSLPASFAVGIRRSKLTSETFDQSAERLRRDQLCEQCAKLAPKLPG
ncbi:hypothetical protein T03_16771 [Trichinella britovi]|uniref:Uncharacterized protein n=2 Tax=Trichinella TaxID=6333 RepID=A0A0V1CZ59_TRIBR|nr:hypothetical protein T05_15431 [Trichinella murrelli]KRX58838.1 hypothetical protein T09_13391 [Trichinella sp. T9]KRX82243.1 hypothetical protein T06_2621 [Trichinella sp. T6]KRY54517.1 hypothetical protein T03_16771 [Trichinella britovi]KRZ88304.1 hypothetical protein T08_11480 [Trichinella sp. T8]